MPLLNANKIVAVGIQAVRGTALADNVLQPIRAFDLSADSTHAIRTLERPSMTGGFGMYRPLYGGSLASVTLSWRITPLIPSVAPNTAAPEHDALYRMAGFTAATDAGNLVRTYNLTSDYANLAFGTIAYFYDGKIRRMRDCVCSAFSVNMEGGGYMTVSATYVGYLIGETDEARPAFLPFATQDPLIADGVGWAFNSSTYSGVASKSFALDLNLETPDRADMGDGEGYAPPTITNRKIGGTLVLEASLNSTADWLANVHDAIENSFRIGIVTPHLFQIDAPTVSIIKPTDADDGGVMTVELGLEFGKTGNGNNEMSFRLGI